MIVKILLILLLILCVGFFSSSETAFLSLSKLKIRDMVEQKRPGALIVAKLWEKMDTFLTTVLIGTNFFGSLTAALSTALAVSVFGKEYVDIVPLIVAFLVTIFGQIIPKTVAGYFPEKISRLFAIPLRMLEIIFFPIIWIFEKLSLAIVKVAEKIIKPTGSIITEEELKTLIDIGQTEGTIKKDESLMLNKLIKFNDLTVSDIMKHRSRVCMINCEATQQEVIQAFLDSGFSTLTVYKENKENVVGILNYKKVLFQSEETDLSTGFAERVMAEVIFVPETFSVLDLLQKFRQIEHKFAIALDEQGQTAGIVTMEDIMKLVFGRMTDENNTLEVPPEDRIQLVNMNTFLIPGDLNLEDVNSILSFHLESDDMNTIGGWLLEKIGFLPSAGTVFVYNKTVFTIEEVQNRRITTIRVKL